MTLQKLKEAVAILETKLSKQVDGSAAVEKSLKKFKTDKCQLQREKARHEQTLKARMETIAKLKESIASLKKNCDTLSREIRNESDGKKLEVDALKRQLRSTTKKLKLAKEENEKQCQELMNRHNGNLTEIGEETRGLTETLSKALGNSGVSQAYEINCNGILNLLGQASQDITTLSERTNSLQEMIKKLEEKAEIQNKSLSNALKGKKSLREELFELSKQNKGLLKDKAKVEREIESLKKESVKAKNLSQSFKIRLEELKANIRCIRREKEAVVQEKQNLEAKLKKLGVDNDALKKELEAKNASKGQGQLHTMPGSDANRLISPKVREELKGMFMKSVEELEDLNTRLLELERRKKETKDDMHSSQAIREYFKRNTSKLVQKYDSMCTRYLNLYSTSLKFIYCSE